MFLCFFLMIRRPPRSTLFPTRRSSDLLGLSPLPCIYASIGSCPEPIEARSEEHTSELQSPDHLVCRLLLEKTIVVARRSSSTWKSRWLSPNGASVSERISTTSLRCRSCFFLMTRRPPRPPPLPSAAPFR